MVAVSDAAQRDTASAHKQAIPTKVHSSGLFTTESVYAPVQAIATAICEMLHSENE